MTTSFERILEGIDLPTIRQLALCPVTNTAGMSLAFDERCTEDRHPELFYLVSVLVFYKYNIKTNEWYLLPSPALAGTFGHGAGAVFVPNQGPSGSLASGCSTTVLNLTTAFPAAVGVNQLANRGDGRGFKIRVIDNVIGGSGKTEEKLIVGNTAGTTPQIALESALSFTPSPGARYELLSGRVYLLSAGTVGAGSWKYYDVATNSYSGNLSTTNLPATLVTDTHLLNYNELYAPNTSKPGQGIIYGASQFNNSTMYCLQATDSSSTTIVGQSVGGDATLVENEYRNFQIRIVEDATTPASVGQRRNITSHTAGPAPAYTVPAWTITPSLNAKFVIEGNSDRIICFTSVTGTNYNYSITADAWDTTTFAVRGANVGAGVMGAFGHGAPRDVTGRFRHSQLYSFRGGATTNLDILDIAGATTGVWDVTSLYGNKNIAFTTGTSGAYDPIQNGGRYLMISANPVSGVGQRNLRFDLVNRVLEPFAYTEYINPSGTVVNGQRCALKSLFYDQGTVKKTCLVTMQTAGSVVLETMVNV